MPMGIGLGIGVTRGGGLGWWPAGSELALEFDNGRGFNSIDRTKTTPDSILTYTSPSPKLVYGSDGVLRYAPQNLVTYSEQFDRAEWVKSNTTVTANQTNAPDGTATADLLTKTSAAYSYVRQAPTTVVGQIHIWSVYAKTGTGTVVVMGSAQTSQYVEFNLTTVTATVTSGVSTSTITSVGNGWYRCTMTITTPTTVTGYEISPKTNGETLYIWGAQREQVLLSTTIAATYIPTTSTAVYSLPIDHNPTTFDPLGVLIEEQRTNLLTYSEQFNDAAWAKSGATITANQTVAPDGTTTADLFTENTANALHAVYQSNAIGSGTVYSLTVYAKKGTRDFLHLLFTSTTTSGHFFSAVFDLNVGVVGETKVGATSGTIVSSSIEELDNGWYRCKVVGSIAQTAAFWVIQSAPSASGNTFNTAGDIVFTGTSSTFYLWGAQLEAGAFPTSYIPTVASQVTRAADRISIAQSSYAFNANAGTFVVEYDLIGYVVNYRVVSGGGSYRYFYGPGSVTTLSSFNGSATITTTIVSPVSNFVKAAMSYDSVGRSITDDGGAVSGLMTDTNPFLTASTTTAFGSDPDGSAPLNGHIKRLTYFPTRRSNADLQVLST